MSIDDLLDRPAPEGARLRAVELLDAARAVRPRLEDPDDAEAVHDFRVALRRLRSQLKAHRPHLGGKLDKLRRRLGDVADATGEARDAEVAQAWLDDQREALIPGHRPALAWLRARLDEGKAAGYAAARRDAGPAFDALEPRIRERLSRYRIDLLAETAGPSFAGDLGRLLGEHSAALVERLAQVASPTDERPAHEARILCKQLRYLLEPLVDSDRVGEPARTAVKALKGLQDLLGELHDAHVLGHRLAQALVDAAAERARRLGSAVLEGHPARPGRDLRPGLTAVTERVRDRRDRLYRGVVQRRRSLDELVRLVARVEERLRAEPGGREIERRYLLSGMPAVPGASEQHIEQGYLPGSRLVERLRRTRLADGSVKLRRAVRLGAGVRRIDVDEDCPEGLFRRLWPLTAGKRLRKRRYQVKEGDLTWRIDRFLDRDLVLAEVEVPAIDTPVTLPPWLAERVIRDVTGEPEYENDRLAGATRRPRARRRTVAQRSPR